MVNLSKDQQTALTALTDARKVYDEQEARLSAEIEAAREAIKRPIREAVARAEALGIPTRRIHLALGLGQVAQLYTFLRPPKGSATAGGALLGSVEPLTPPEPEDVGPFTLTPGNSDEGDPWLATDKNGKVYKLMFGGASEQTPHSFIKWQLEEIPEKYREEIKQEIEDYHNGWVTWD